MKEENILKFYEVDIYLECVYKGELLVPLLSFCNEEDKKFVNDEYYAFFDDVIASSLNIMLINRKIKKYLKFRGIPTKLLFTLAHEEGNYVYITEMITGIELMVKKSLIDKCKVSYLKARSHFMKYSDREMEKIYDMMSNAEKVSQRSNCQIIDFESRKIRRK